jgi:hypothetical protein
MADGGRREVIDAAITLWERDLERLRLALANAGDAMHAEHHARFVALYDRKEVVKSRWELLRGAYRPDAEAVQRFKEAFGAMEAAWGEAQSMRIAVLEVSPIGGMKPPGVPRSHRTAD